MRAVAVSVYDFIVDVGENAKGMLLMVARRQLSRSVPREVHERVVADLSDVPARLMKSELTPLGHYSLKGTDEVIERYAQAADTDPRDFARQLGRWVVEYQGRTPRALLGLLARPSVGSLSMRLYGAIVTPERVARLFPVAFSQVYDSGHLSGEYDPRTRTIRFHLVGWRAHTDLLCMTVLGTAEEVARLVPDFAPEEKSWGARVQCIALGDPVCEFELVGKHVDPWDDLPTVEPPRS